MNQTETSITQLEEEIRQLRSQLEESKLLSNFEMIVQERTDELSVANEELNATNEELNAVNDQLNETVKKLEDAENIIRNFIDQSFEGIIMMNSEGRVVEWNEKMNRILGLTREEARGKYEWEVLHGIIPEEIRQTEETLENFRQSRREYFKIGRTLEPVLTERELYMIDGKKHFLELYTFPINLADTCYFAKIIRDVTQQKIADMELEKYQTELEKMVGEKTAEVVAQQKRLEKISSRQEILIKVLNIVQSSEDLLEAMDVSIAEIGKYAGVSHAYIFEKNNDDATISCTHEWCNTGVLPIYNRLQDMPLQTFGPWFDTFDAGEVISVSDIATLNPDAAKLLASLGVKSTVVLPLTTLGVNYGFVAFDDCNAVREWEQNEVELLRSLSQLVSNTTHRYHAEKAISLSQQTMRTVLDNIAANIFVVDFETMKILFANKSIKKMVGEEIEGQICWQVLHTGKNDVCETCPKRYFDTGNQFAGVYHWEQYNDFYGRCYANDITAIEWVDGRLVQMEVATDITDRKLAEEAVRQSEAMYRQLTVASPDAIVVCGPDGHVRYVSPKALELFGLNDGAEIVNQQMGRFVHPHDRRHAIELFRKLWGDNVHFIPQLLLLHRDGTEFIGEVSAATVKDAKNQTVSIIMVIRDITRRKMDEMELIHAKEKAEESDKLKSAFLANMSHEIRTPINGIVGFLQLLASDDLPPESKQDYVNEINNSCTRLVKQIEDIIDMAKIEANQMNISPVTVSVNDLMREVHAYFDNYLQTNNINERLTLFLDDSAFTDRCVTYVDPLRLRQTLTNLIDNAIKFTPNGYIRFGYRQSAHDELEFMVEDTGIGLPPDYQEVIFESFRQAELTNSRIYGGNGLGLTIARGLVQMMGGDMRIESTEGKGSTFYFTVSYLPVATEDIDFFDKRQDTSSGEKIFADKLVLVVEPVIMKYMYYKILLSAAGFTVQHAENVHRWLDFIRQTNHIDAVMVNASVFEHAYDVEIGQIKSIRAGLPTFMYGVKQNMKHANNQNYTVLEEPMDYGKIVEAMSRVMR